MQVLLIGNGEFMRRLIGVLSVVLLGGIATDVAVAATFDCSKASTDVETMICNDETVNAADDELARIYQFVRSQEAGAVAEQRAWLEEVRNICRDAECLSDAYLQRIAKLEESAARIKLSADLGGKRSDISAVLPEKPERYPTSFDCSARLSAVQNLICTEPTLAAADIELTNLVRQWSTTTTYDATTQRRWIADVRDRCTSADCLSNAYLRRIDQLEKTIEPANPKVTALESNGIVSNTLTHIGLSHMQSEARKQYLSLILWGTAIFFVVIFVLGANKKLVICYSFADLIWTMVPMIALTVCGAAFAFGGSWGEMVLNVRILAVLSGALGIYGIVRNFITSIQHNRSLIAGLLVGLFKLLLSLMAFILIFGSGRSSNDRESRNENRMGTIVGVLLGYWLYRCVVNGPEVYEAKGWESVEAH